MSDKSMTGKWSEINDYEMFEKAMHLAKGTYQKNLLNGLENLSGSTLAGSAKKEYGYKYYVSRKHLLARLSSNKIIWFVKTVEHGARILVIGEPAFHFSNTTEETV